MAFKKETSRVASKHPAGQRLFVDISEVTNYQPREPFKLVHQKLILSPIWKNNKTNNENLKVFAYQNVFVGDGEILRLKACCCYYLPDFTLLKGFPLYR